LQPLLPSRSRGSDPDTAPKGRRALTLALPWVALGVVLAMWVARVTPNRFGQAEGVPPVPRSVGWAALLGGVAGAYLFEAPADLAGWSQGSDGTDTLGWMLGRTVLGGLLGGWISVEVVKARVG